MNDDRLTEKLAANVLGWKSTPGRFLKAGRSWIPSWHFKPLIRVDDAFQLLDAVASSYRLAKDKDGTFTAEVHVDGRTGKASGEPKAKAITLAFAKAIGLEVSR